MPSTYEPIATATLTATSTSITISSIPSTYTDLVAIGYFDGIGESYIQAQLNSDTGNNYDYIYYGGVNATMVYNVVGNINSMPGSRADEEANYQMHLFNYTSNLHKTAFIMNANASSPLVYHSVSNWRNTAAVTSISWVAQQGQYAAGTTITIYGIKAA
jgi:hypothetical protein